MTDEELKRLATSALTEAAARLGVDPFRLARFLSDGRLAEILMGARSPRARPGATAAANELAEICRAFLEYESLLQAERETQRSEDLG